MITAGSRREIRAIAYSLTEPLIYTHFCSAGGRQCKRQVCIYAAWRCLLADSWQTGWHVPCLCCVERCCAWRSKVVKDK